MLNLRIVVAVLLLTCATQGSHAQTLSFSIEGEVAELEITHCRTASYQSGQLVIEAEVTAAGTFRGQPAALLLAKSTGAKFNAIDLYLTELSPELRTMPPLEAKNKIEMDHATLYGQREAEINADFQDKLSKLPPEEMPALGDELAERRQALEAEMDALLPTARVFGVITVDGTTIGFEGNHQTSLSRSEQEEAFADLENEVRVVAQCAT